MELLRRTGASQRCIARLLTLSSDVPLNKVYPLQALQSVSCEDKVLGGPASACMSHRESPLKMALPKSTSTCEPCGYVQFRKFEWVSLSARIPCRRQSLKSHTKRPSSVVVMFARTTVKFDCGPASVPGMAKGRLPWGGGGAERNRTRNHAGCELQRRDIMSGGGGDQAGRREMTRPRDPRVGTG